VRKRGPKSTSASNPAPNLTSCRLLTVPGGVGLSRCNKNMRVHQGSKTCNLLLLLLPARFFTVDRSLTDAVIKRSKLSTHPLRLLAPIDGVIKKKKVVYEITHTILTLHTCTFSYLWLSLYRFIINLNIRALRSFVSCFSF
jgi:hypothetical protein